MTRDPGVEFVGAGGDPIDDAMPVIADQIVERVQIVAHASGLLRERVDQPTAALADNGAE